MESDDDDDFVIKREQVPDGNSKAVKVIEVRAQAAVKK